MPTYGEIVAFRHLNCHNDGQSCFGPHSRRRPVVTSRSLPLEWKLPRAGLGKSLLASEDRPAERCYRAGAYPCLLPDFSQALKVKRLVGTTRTGTRWNRPETSIMQLNSWIATYPKFVAIQQSGRIENVTLLMWLFCESDWVSRSGKIRRKRKDTRIYNAGSVINAARRRGIAFSFAFALLHFLVYTGDVHIFCRARTRMPTRTINFFLDYRIVAVVVTPCNAKEIP